METKLTRFSQDPENLNKGTDKGRRMLSQSIQDLGAGRSILVDRNGVIIAGNKTAEAAIAEGLEDAIVVQTQGDKVVVVQRTDLDLTTDPKAKQLAIADNRIAEIDLSWDAEALQKLAEEVDLSWLEVDDNFFEELEAMESEELKPEQLEPLTDEDDIPDEEDVETRVKRGDIWQLGRHRVMCGDSTFIDDVDKLMDGEKADMVFTDPPYGMRLDTDFSGMKSKILIGSGNKYDHVEGDFDDYDPTFILTTFKDVKEIFLWGADYYAERISERNNGSWIVWDKRAGDGVSEEREESLSRTFGSGFELCWSKQKHQRIVCRILWNGMFGMGKDDEKKRVHPTQKPVALAEWFFDKWGKDCWKVVDLFLGSGSTLIACEKTGRTCYGMELSEKYCDVILKRWEDFTGKTAVRINDTDDCPNGKIE